MLCGIGLGIASANAAVIKVAITNPVPDAKVVLKFENNEKEEFTVDANGKGMIELNNFTAQYVTLQYGRSTRTLYLDPHMDLSMSFEGKRMYKAISFTGAGAAANSYLNSGKLAQASYQEAKLPEKEFIKTTDSLYYANMKELNSHKLPAAFANAEKKRLKYYSYLNFPMFTIYHAYMNKLKDFKASPNFYRRLKELTDINPDLLVFNEYKEFLFNAITTLGLNGDSYTDQLSLLKSQLNYIENNVKNPTVREHLVYTVAYNYVKRSGVDEADIAVKAVNKYVDDAEKKGKFDKVYQDWKKIAVGQPSPVFSGKDMNGNVVTLHQLKGKFIYIDVWATWCGPCRGELPHLKKLEEQFRGKAVEFVSLSCDQKEAPWKKTVEKEQLKGVQLHIGSGSKFMQEYMISGIPRFILLDKEGKIISANMSRPSDPATAKKLNELLGL